MTEYIIKVALISIAIVAGAYALAWYGRKKQIEQGALKHCPSCRELIDGKATACKHCGRDVP